MALSRRHVEISKPEPPIDQKEDIIAKLLAQVENSDTTDRIVRLHKIATRPLSLLTSEQCADLDAIRKLSRSAYGTDVYSTLHTKIISQFGEGIVYQPNTVGSWFMGCMVSNNLTQISPDVNPGCALTCADSLPPPGKTWGFCSQNVVWCVWASQSVARNSRRASGRIHIDHSGDDNFDFIYITYIPSSSRAILYVDYKTYDEFPGFTRHEKARLIHRMKITDVKLLSYDFEDNSVEYKDLLGKPIKVLGIKPRADPRDNETVAQRTARRARVAKKMGVPVNTDSDSPMTWQQAVTLAVALAVLVILGICAGFVISHLRSRAVVRKLNGGRLATRRVR